MCWHSRLCPQSPLPTAFRSSSSPRSLLLFGCIIRLPQYQDNSKISANNALFSLMLILLADDSSFTDYQNYFLVLQLIFLLKKKIHFPVNFLHFDKFQSDMTHGSRDLKFVHMNRASRDNREIEKATSSFFLQGKKLVTTLKIFDEAINQIRQKSNIW